MKSELSKNLNLTNKTLIQELARQIKAGVIKIGPIGWFILPRLSMRVSG